jgi:2-keto-4-pentenoate hydratase/2-oxohepta-3-ene-1,7-dioic acid hydratase in catechol pathway
MTGCRIYKARVDRPQGESHNTPPDDIPSRSLPMRLATILTPHGPRAAVAVGDRYVDLHATDPGLPTSVKLLLAASPAVRKAAAEAAASRTAVSYAAGQVQLLPPVPDPGKILCIGLNYRDHAIEGGKAIPVEPVVFGKFPNTLIGPGDPIRIPRVAQKVDYEAELVIVIGKRGKHIPNDSSAFAHVGGYTCGHDVSARDWQFRGEEKQWMIGKTFDTFAPTGPVLVTADELTDPHKLPVKLRLNGETMQNSNTREFIFGVPHLLWFLSQVVTLEPGDLIFTGTPPGVGIARKPPVLLKPGDEVEVEIEGIGVLKNPCVAE